MITLSGHAARDLQVDGLIIATITFYQRFNRTRAAVACGRLNR